VGICWNKNYVIFVYLLTSKIKINRIYTLALARLIHGSETSATALESHFPYESE
jgi:hypothetical protein